jgi:hypothetical protein
MFFARASKFAKMKLSRFAVGFMCFLRGIESAKVVMLSSDRYVSLKFVAILSDTFKAGKSWFAVSRNVCTVLRNSAFTQVFKTVVQAITVFVINVFGVVARHKFPYYPRSNIHLLVYADQMKVVGFDPVGVFGNVTRYLAGKFRVPPPTVYAGWVAPPIVKVSNGAGFPAENTFLRVVVKTLLKVSLRRQYNALSHLVLLHSGQNPGIGVVTDAGVRILRSLKYSVNNTLAAA